MLLILEVLSIIAPAILPSVDTFAMHQVILPGALKLATIDPIVNACSVDSILSPAALIL